MVTEPKLPNETQLRLLAIIGTEELAGREIAKRYEKEVERSISYGSLYVALQRLRDEGWVTYSDSEDEDGRVRIFRVSGAGARAVAAARTYHRRLSTFGLTPGFAS